MSELYAPTTEDVKQRWLEAHRVPASLGSEQIGHLRQQRLAEFDAWLAKVKADAWDACVSQSEACGYIEPNDASELESIFNPYRQGADNG